MQKPRNGAFWNCTGRRYRRAPWHDLELARSHPGADEPHVPRLPLHTGPAPAGLAPRVPAALGAEGDGSRVSRGPAEERCGGSAARLPDVAEDLPKGCHKHVPGRERSLGSRGFLHAMRTVVPTERFLLSWRRPSRRPGLTAGTRPHVFLQAKALSASTCASLALKGR